MIGSTFELNKRTYILSEEKVGGSCSECVFENIQDRKGNLCSLPASAINNDGRSECQVSSGIFLEFIPEVKKGIKKNLKL